MNELSKSNLEQCDPWDDFGGSQMARKCGDQPRSHRQLETGFVQSPRAVAHWASGKLVWAAL